MNTLQSDLILKDKNTLVKILWHLWAGICFHSFYSLCGQLITGPLLNMFFATVVRKLNSEWTCSQLMQATHISCSGSADFSICGSTSSESRVTLWVCWASFLKRGPGVFVVQPYGPDGCSLCSKSHPFVPADLLTESSATLWWFACHRRHQCFTRLLLGWSVLRDTPG